MIEVGIYVIDGDNIEFVMSPINSDISYAIFVPYRLDIMAKFFPDEIYCLTLK